MNILLIGSGGREHAIAYKIAQSKHLDKLYIAPGNGGTASLGTNVDISVSDFPAISNFIVSNSIDMLVVGPEVPLADGIVDYLKDNCKNKSLKIIGPTAAGATIESSKEFAKRFMNAHGIPTAKHKAFSANNIDEGYKFLESLKPPYVLKADGLAAGKGVLILNDLEEAKTQLHEMLCNNKFGTSGATVIIEDFLKGIELSVFILTDGCHYVLLPEAKDYKRIGEHDTGLNTGGMGSISPVPFADKTFMDKVENRIIKPTIDGLIDEGIKYVGFIFFGLINCGGDPYVIEYNCRMGDPETESVFPRINNDILELFSAAADRRLNEMTMDISPDSVATVMLVSKGYPEKYPKGMPISFDNPDKDDIIFHAGTKYDADNQLVANGGRVITATARGHNMTEAFGNAYKLADKIYFDNKYFRKDLGTDLTNLK